MKITIEYDSKVDELLLNSKKNNKIEWIRCNTRLPINSKPKLVCDVDNCMFVAFWSESSVGWREKKSCLQLVFITHWCELPDAPERE